MSAPLKDFIEQPLDPGLVAREWEAIQAARRRRKAPLSALAAALLSSKWAIAPAIALAMAMLLGVVLRHREPAAIAEGAWLESGAEGRRVALADGTSLLLDANSRVHVVSTRTDPMRIDLEQGGLRIEATREAGRALVVSAAGYEARARGDRFVVHRLGFAIDVRAERGDVVVARPDGGTQTVHAGETWRGDANDAPRDPSPVPVESAMPAPSPSTSSSALAPPGGPQSTAPQPGNNAKALFDAAERARAEGHPRETARLLDKLRRTYRRDPRAGLAAFELGRLRLDALDDARGAEEAFRDAIALAPQSPFHEDAEARRVQALARLGDHAGCLAASEAYLSRYPAGAYRKAVMVYCGPP